MITIKRFFIVCILSLFIYNSNAQITLIAGPVWIEDNTVLPSIPIPEIDIWDKFEIGFLVSPQLFSNPYDPSIVDLFVAFTAPTGETIYKNAFWYVNYTRNFAISKPADAVCNATYLDEDPAYLVKESGEHGPYPWRVRFSTNLSGQWEYHLYSNTGGTMVDLEPGHHHFFYVS